MSKPTDAERKEVAENLRKNADAHKGMPLLLNVAFAAFGDDARDLMEETVTSQMAAHRLADLIDPVCENKQIRYNRESPFEFRNDNFICSSCGETFFADEYHVNSPIDWAYCPNCGARVASCDD